MLEFHGIHATIHADTNPEVDAEGGRNSGKTTVCLDKVIQSCLDYPGIEWLICRYSGEETKTKLRPAFLTVCCQETEKRAAVYPEWNGEESCYRFPEQQGKVSKVFAYGLKTQDKNAHFAKIRGLGVACVYVDQTEELPEEISTELRAVMRQPGFPHQLLYSPNPPGEDHFLADEFPEDNHLPGRHYYRVSLYDNAHNLPEQTIIGLEQAYPKTHAKHKSLILGQRGVNVIGTPVYEDAFLRETHVGVATYDPDSTLLEAIDAGKHHPVWIAAQRSTTGGLIVLAGLMGKRLFLEDFLPIVDRYRAEWFDDPLAHDRKVLVCCDPPPADETQALRFTNVQILRAAGFKPRYADNANAPDVREAVIQNLAGRMKRRSGIGPAFLVNTDPTHWLMASHTVVKQSKFFVDGLEGAYVWDEHFVSVGNKKVRQPKVDQWVEGAQRCLENLELNFNVRPREAADLQTKKITKDLLAPQRAGWSG